MSQTIPPEGSATVCDSSCDRFKWLVCNTCDLDFCSVHAAEHDAEACRAQALESAHG